LRHPGQIQDGHLPISNRLCEAAKPIINHEFWLLARCGIRCEVNPAVTPTWEWLFVGRLRVTSAEDGSGP